MSGERINKFGCNITYGLIRIKNTQSPFAYINDIIWEISSAQIFHETPHIILHFISLVIASENLEYINSLEMIGERRE